MPPKLSYSTFLVLLLTLVSTSVIAQSQKVIKILAIGNSFSEDALENNFYEIAKEKNIPVIVGNLYIGGAPLHLHVANARENKAVYAYRKVINGQKTNTPRTALETALTDEDWDYISFQQASPLSGQAETIAKDLPELVRYVQSKATNPAVQYVYHQTWAYSQHAIHPGFANYNNDQLTMYKGIVNASKNVKNIAPITILVPAGTAIQNARTSYIGDNFDRDGYHLRLSLGRYVAALTWFETLFRQSTIGIQFKPVDVSESEKLVAQNAAHAAAKNPYEVTTLTQFSKSPTTPKKVTAPILIDIAGNDHTKPWNPISSPKSGKIYALKDSLFNQTNVNFTFDRSFKGTKIMTDATTYWQDNALKTAYFTTAEEGPITLELSGLSKKQTYQLSLISGTDDTSVTTTPVSVQIAGKKHQTNILQANETSKQVIVFSNTKPNKKGIITLTLTPTNQTGNMYLNAIRIAPTR